MQLDCAISLLSCNFRQDAAHSHAHAAKLQSSCRLPPVCSFTVHTACLAVITKQGAAHCSAHVTASVAHVILDCIPSKRCV